MEYDDIEAIVNSVARIALEGIVEKSYTQAERERLEHAALTGEWRPIPPLGALAAQRLANRQPLLRREMVDPPDQRIVDRHG